MVFDIYKYDVPTQISCTIFRQFNKSLIKKGYEPKTHPCWVNWAGKINVLLPLQLACWTKKKLMFYVC